MELQAHGIILIKKERGSIVLLPFVVLRVDTHTNNSHRRWSIVHLTKIDELGHLCGSTKPRRSLKIALFVNPPALLVVKNAEDAAIRVFPQCSQRQVNSNVNQALVTGPNGCYITTLLLRYGTKALVFCRHGGDPQLLSSILALHEECVSIAAMKHIFSEHIGCLDMSGLSARLPNDGTVFESYERRIVGIPYCVVVVDVHPLCVRRHIL